MLVSTPSSATVDVVDIAVVGGDVVVVVFDAVSKIRTVHSSIDEKIKINLKFELEI